MWILLFVLTVNGEALDSGSATGFRDRGACERAGEWYVEQGAASEYRCQRDRTPKLFQHGPGEN